MTKKNTTTYSANYGFFDGSEHTDLLEVRCKTKKEAYKVAHQLKEAHFNDYAWTDWITSNPAYEGRDLSRAYSWVEVRKGDDTIENMTVNLY